MNDLFFIISALKGGASGQLKGGGQWATL